MSVLWIIENHNVSSSVQDTKNDVARSCTSKAAGPGSSTAWVNEDQA